MRPFADRTAAQATRGPAIAVRPRFCTARGGDLDGPAWRATFGERARLHKAIRRAARCALARQPGRRAGQMQHRARTKPRTRTSEPAWAAGYARRAGATCALFSWFFL